jgi:hypothetical protein
MKCSSLFPKDIAIVNNFPIPELSPDGEKIWVSDHYGLLASLST